MLETGSTYPYIYRRRRRIIPAISAATITKWLKVIAVKTGILILLIPIVILTYFILAAGVIAEPWDD